MKSFHTVILVIGLVFLLFLVLKIGPATLWGTFDSLGWGLLVMILLNGAGKFFHAIGWRYCLSAPYRSLPFFHVFSIRMAGFSITQLTPTATIGGDLTMGTLLSMAHRGPEAATSVMIGKLSHTLAQLLFALLGTVLILLVIHPPRWAWVSMLTGSVLLGLGLLAFFLVQKYGKIGGIVRWLVARKIGGNRLTRASSFVTGMDEDLKFFFAVRPGDFYLSLLWNIMALACGILQTWVFFAALTEYTSLLVTSCVWFLSCWFEIVSFAIPTNIGYLEGTSVLVLKIAGFSSALGLTYGLALRLGQIFWSAIGLLLYGRVVRTLRNTGGKVPVLP